VLRIACHYLSELLPDVTYFPAYELLVDDLRDYRFYAADMLHPSPVAEDYVWDRFAREYFNSDFGRFRKEWDAVRQAMAHRPLHPAAPEHRQFLEATLTRLQRLGNQVDVRAEMREVQKQLHSLPVPIQPEPVPADEPDEDDEERIDIGQVENTPQPANTTVAVTATPLPYSAPAVTHVEEAATDTEVAPDAADDTPPVIPFKKKRRSRGGAKRSGRKKAAQLAASLADAATDALIVSSPEESVAVELAPSPDAEPQADVYTDVIIDVPEEAPTETALPPSETSANTVNEELPTQAEEAAPVRPKRRTAAQVKAAKTARKPAKSTSAKATIKPKAERPSRSKPPKEAEPAPSPLPAASPQEDATPPAADAAPAEKAPQRRARPARKKPAAPADQSASES
jgi:hypothetical protein